MAKNSTKNTQSTEPLKAKISTGIGNFYQFHLGSSGTTVEMSAKDHNYVKEAFKRMEKAQEILKNYYYSQE